MSHRFALVVGSQCDKLNRLDALPATVERLSGILFDSELGAWQPAIREGLIIDPSVTELQTAMHEAFDIASRREGTLLFVFVGHGTSPDGDFYLLPKDGDPNGPLSAKAINLNQTVKDLIRHFSSIQGMVVILDTCHSGSAVIDAAHRLVGGFEGRVSLEYLSSTDLREAYNCNFTKLLCEIIELGVTNGPQELTCGYLKDQIARHTDNIQVPFNLVFNSSSAPYLCHNIQLSAPWQKSRHGIHLVELLRESVPVGILGKIVEQAERSRILALVGPPGTGKSTLIASIAHLRMSTSTPRTVQAIVFLDEASKDYDIANELDSQLKANFGSLWKSGVDRDSPFFRYSNPILRKLGDPLAKLPKGTSVRVAFDALDQCPTQVRDTLLELMAFCCAEFTDVGFLISSVEQQYLPATAVHFEVPKPSEGEMKALLERRGISEDQRDDIIRTADGSWLIAGLLAEDHVPGETMRSIVLDELYSSRIAVAGDGEEKGVVSILGYVAVPELGHQVPLNALRRALVVAGDLQADEIDRLVRKLSRLLVRSTSGEASWIGAFHQTFVDFIRRKYAKQWGGYFDRRTDNLAAALRQVWSNEYAAADELLYARRVEPELEWAGFLRIASCANEEFFEVHTFMDRSHVSDVLQIGAQKTLRSLELGQSYEERSPLEWRQWSERFSAARSLENLNNVVDNTLLELALTARCYEVIQSLLGTYARVDLNDWCEFDALLGDAESLDGIDLQGLKGLRSRCKAVAFGEQDDYKLQEAFMMFIQIAFQAQSRIRFRCWRRWFNIPGAYGREFEDRFALHQKLISDSLMFFGPDDIESVEMIDAVHETCGFFGGDRELMTKLFFYIDKLELPTQSKAELKRAEVKERLYDRLDAISRSAMYW